VSGFPHGGGGGGVEPSNYLAAGNLDVVDLGSQAAVLLTMVNTEGSPGFAIDADTQHLDCLDTGIYVVSLAAEVTVTGAALSPYNVVSLRLVCDNVADVDALANEVLFYQDLPVDQSQSYETNVMLTTPPMAFAAGDQFYAAMGATFAVAAGVTLALPITGDLSAVVVRLG
jgi:hypothetical protein